MSNHKVIRRMSDWRNWSDARFYLMEGHPPVAVRKWDFLSARQGRLPNPWVGPRFHNLGVHLSGVPVRHAGVCIRAIH